MAYPAIREHLTSMVIRPYQGSDRKASVGIFNSNTPTFFAASELVEFEEWLDHQEHVLASTASPLTDYYYVLEVNQRVIACGGFHLELDRTQATLAWGMVDHSWHRQGVGRDLLAYRLRQIRAFHPNFAILLDTTQHAYEFFQKFGFTVMEVTKDYYAVGLDRYDMRG